MSARVDAAKEILHRIETAYHQRKDYPPFALVSFEDRPRYHLFVVKIIKEYLEEESA